MKNNKVLYNKVLEDSKKALYQNSLYLIDNNIAKKL